MIDNSMDLCRSAASRATDGSEDLSPYVQMAFNDFSYNLGNGTFCASPVAAYLRTGNVRAACGGITLYNKARKNDVLVELPGLTKRRALEQMYCSKGGVMFGLLDYLKLGAGAIVGGFLVYAFMSLSVSRPHPGRPAAAARGEDSNGTNGEYCSGTDTNVSGRSQSSHTTCCPWPRVGGDQSTGTSGSSIPVLSAANT